MGVGGGALGEGSGVNTGGAGMHIVAGHVGLAGGGHRAMGVGGGALGEGVSEVGYAADSAGEKLAKGVVESTMDKDWVKVRLRFCRRHTQTHTQTDTHTHARTYAQHTHVHASECTTSGGGSTYTCTNTLTFSSARTLV